MDKTLGHTAISNGLNTEGTVFKPYSILQQKKTILHFLNLPTKYQIYPTTGRFKGI